MPGDPDAAGGRASSPPARLSRVDLPDPDGPITATSSPAATVRVRPRSACTAASPDPWMRTTSVSSSTGSVIGPTLSVWALTARGRACDAWPRRCRAARSTLASQWSSQRSSASVANRSDSSTSDQDSSAAPPWSVGPPSPPGGPGACSALSRVSSCRPAQRGDLRCDCTTWVTSIPGTVTASASLMASSSRGRSARSTGRPNQPRSSALPVAVIA